MYRPAPPNALFQGDVILTLLPRLDFDPVVITMAPKGCCEYCHKPLPEPAAECPNCFAPVAIPPRDITCSHCEKKIRVRGPKRHTPLKARIDGKETIFSKDYEHCAVNVQPVAAMILSQACDIDQKDFIRLAVVSAIANQPDYVQEMLRAQLQGKGEGNFPLFYLPPSDRLPEAVVDFDRTFHVEATTLGHQESYHSTVRNVPDNACVPFVEIIKDRLVSLSAEGLFRLQVRLIQHLGRLADSSKIELEPPGEAALTPDPGAPPAAARKERGWLNPMPKWLKEKNPR